MTNATSAAPAIPVETTRVEVLPGPSGPPVLPGGAPTGAASAVSAGPKYWYHPLSGWLILAVDWLFFGPEALTTGLASIVTAPLAFLITFSGVYFIQRRRNLDSRGGSVLKAMLGALLAAIPTAISGTALGALVLLLSGLTAFNHRQPPGR